jgi:ribonuclease VapC
MIVDSSALVSILLEEPDAESFSRAIVERLDAAVSVANVLEVSVVARTTGGQATEARIDPMLAQLGLNVIPVDLAQGQAAREAHRRFGKGTGHPAKLNFGDCFAYALAKASGRPLLYKGADFALTDIEPALPRRR